MHAMRLHVAQQSLNKCMYALQVRPQHRVNESYHRRSQLLSRFVIVRRSWYSIWCTRQTLITDAVGTSNDTCTHLRLCSARVTRMMMSTHYVRSIHTIKPWVSHS